jgi:Ca2+-binding EF-hand superfamily protein
VKPGLWFRFHVDCLQAALRKEAQSTRTAITTFPTHASSSSSGHRRASLIDGTLLHGTEEELADLRRIFDLFDTNRNGNFTALELQALHARLGEPITAEEASVAIECMTWRGKVSVTFEEFVKYWDREHFE